MVTKAAAVLAAAACVTAVLLRPQDSSPSAEPPVVAESLWEDGRIGKIVDARGVVSLRPMTSDRWTPVCRPLLVKPGDWLRTDVRGANAAALITTSHRKLTAGPGSLLELTEANRVKLHSGELKVAGGAHVEGDLELSGPIGEPLSIPAERTVHYRIDREGRLQSVVSPPRWLRGFEGTTADDSIGSLIVNVDGRNVPLTIGYHKVNVEIRDQIARTTIEESFVNRTGGRMEGVFHFPLPQDASISGFGMWINGELIEADVVEKQRAREIYETILRERRDPALLEWTGGNIFKARVFPIEPHSEKRIKIVYTQVLPLRANEYRYAYGLRSEMLQKTPLRELSLSVTVNSALPLKSVHSPTHAVRAQQTEHSAKLEFTAQEFTPDRDFEVVCEVDPNQPDVVVVPHRRGDDGYFMVQLTPPTTDGNWQRETVPDGEPLDILLACDTSASMDSEKRRQQEEFVASVLASLGPSDRFNIVVCDVDSHWWKDESVAPTTESIDAARGWLADRVSLGWTDLDRMIESLLPRLGERTQAIYVGDGIVTARDADPQAFAHRIRQMTAGKRAGTFHAVSVGNSYETTVLKAIAQGGGSVRRIGNDQTAQQTAYELLNELAQPAIRDLKVEFHGLQVAVVYPDELPNLAAGMQQILLGRYLPQGENQSGEIVITGRRGDESVRFSARISLADAETGNSFIPRLWARAHLDQLLAQGSSPLVRDEIIAMSEEFHIITPYTSLLVLETDADRERFNVKRRFQMRDGERFFADARDNAKYELLQQQMEIAGEWRQGLRSQILSHLSRLGRQREFFQYLHQNGRLFGTPNRSWELGNLGYEVVADELDEMLSLTDFSLEQYRRAMGGGMGGGGMGGAWGVGRGEADFDWSSADDGEWSSADVPQEYSARSGPLTSTGGARDEAAFSTQSAAQARYELPKLHVGSGGMYGGGGYGLRGGYGGDRYHAYEHTEPLRSILTLMPDIPAPAAIVKEAAPTWSEEAVAISRALDQPPRLDGGGIELSWRTESIDPVWERVRVVSNEHQLFSQDRWLHYDVSSASQTVVHWFDGRQRGAYSRAFQIGRARDAKAGDLESFTLGHQPYADGKLHTSYRGYDVEIERLGDERVALLLDMKQSGAAARAPRLPAVRISIDTERQVVLETVRSDGNDVTGTTRYSDHVEVAGVWWPTKIESFDGAGRRTSSTTLDVKRVDADTFQRRFEEEMPGDEAVLIGVPLPSVGQSESAVAAGADATEHRLVLLLRSALVQQWDDVFKELEAIERLQSSKPGLWWLRAAVLIAARRNNDARQLLQQQADQLVEGGRSDELYLGRYLLDLARPIVESNESLSLLEQLRPLFERQPQHANALWDWKNRRLRSISALDRGDEVLALSRELAEAAPWNSSAQTTYVYALRNAGDHAAAYAWLRAQIDRQPEQAAYGIPQLRSTYLDLLREDGRVDDLIAYLKEWVDQEPEQSQAYEQYLNALLMGRRTDDAAAAVRRWIDEGQIEGTLSTARLARLTAAVSYALGHRHQTRLGYIDPQWREPLRKTAMFFLDHDHHIDLVARIINDPQFRDTDEADRILMDVARRLKEDAEALATNKLQSFVRWTVDRKDLTPEEWRQIATVLRNRLDAEDQANRQALEWPLLQIYRTHFRDSLQLPFMRDRIEWAEGAEQPALAASHRLGLFNELLERKWDPEHEAEAIGLIHRLAATDRVTQRLAVQLDALHRFVDRMVQARYESETEALQDQGHPEELTRAELSARHSEYRKAAIEGVAARLAEAADRLDGSAPPEDAAAHDELIEWIRMERMHLDLRLDREHQQVAAELWEMIGDQPPMLAEKQEADADNDVDFAGRRLVELHRVERAVAMLTFLAARPSAPEDLIERLEAYFAAGLERQGEAALPWKQARFALMIAMDRPDELEGDLREWIRTDPLPARWQRTLARLLAERGQIEEAITLLEVVERNSQLSSADYAALADWYLVAGRREQYEQAKIQAFMVWPEHEISSWLSDRQKPWHHGDQPLPSELDEEVLLAYRALFKKLNRPLNYIDDLKGFYTACRDFRLLQMLPDAVIGHTPQQIYPVLERMNSSLMPEIRNEATADEILQRLAVVREQCESAVDLRALDLLEALVERRSAEVLNQPRPHIAAAVAAFRRAFDHQWAEGEIRQMAKLLDTLASSRQRDLQREWQRELRILYNTAEPGTDDRLFVSWHFAHALFNHFSDQDGGLAIMEIAVREYRASHPAGWPAHANEPLGGYVDMLESRNRFVAADKLLTDLLGNSLNDSQHHWLLQRRDELWTRALRIDAPVLIGSGETLYRNFHKILQERLATDQKGTHQQRTVDQLLGIYQIGYRKGFQRCKEDLREFAFEQLPPLLERPSTNYQHLVMSTAETLNKLLGAREGVRFLLERFEIDDPPRFDARASYHGGSARQRMLGEMADWRSRPNAAIGDLEPRLLTIVLNELRYDLQSRHPQARFFYSRQSRYYWAAKEEEFAAVAEEVLQESRDSKRGVTYIAQYFYEGLHRYQRAIEVLLAAHGRGLLDDPQQIVLVNFLHNQKRYAESIPILEPLVARDPDQLGFRVQLLTSYYRSERPEQLRELLAETNRRFRQDGRWTESVLAQLASACKAVERFTEAIGYYEEAISLRQRTAPNRGIADGTLSDYYSQLARCYTAMGNTRKAVDAAAAGVVAWGPHRSERQYAIESLRQVFADAEDLDAYVRLHDQQAEETGQDSPLIRQQIGAVYVERGMPEKAIEQFQIALALQPYDVQTHQQLIAVYRTVGDQQAAIEQTLVLLDIDRHNLALYKDLAQQLKSDEALAERAATTLVEAAPNEAEHHQALAELRQEQDRWDDAIKHWQQVAELRRLEPTGLIGLAEAQIHQERFEEARRTIDRLNRTDWPARFDSVRYEVDRLQRRMTTPR